MEQKKIGRRRFLGLLAGGVVTGFGLASTLQGSAAFVVSPGAPEETGAPDLLLDVVLLGDPRYNDDFFDRGNDRARRAILSQFQRESARAVIFVGDLVLKGTDTRDWGTFNRLVAPLRSRGQQIIPVLGNHELEGGPTEVALRNYFANFPELKGQRWYSQRMASCLFIICDSQSPMQSGSPQGDWIRHKLETVPEDVDFVLIIMHHPVYTRSTKSLFHRGHPALAEHTAFGKELEQLQRELHATIMVISGHVHNYERYIVNGPTYIVSGGGGGTPHSISRRSTDFYQDPGDTFHFLRLRMGPNCRLQVSMVKLMSLDNPRWEIRDSFELTPTSSKVSCVAQEQKR
ncbi:MAG: hypothetical protein CXZ00_15810 [Acidobacteria bacterium]|nr:MAG: hypothetical protein CXZ00_15810 [Acidobacteriota bacterium]